MSPDHPSRLRLPAAAGLLAMYAGEAINERYLRLLL